MANKFNFQGYASHIHVSGEMFAAASKDLGNEKKQIEWLEGLTQEGYNISIKGNQEDGNITVSLAGSEVSPNFNKGHTLSAFGGNLSNSLYALWAKHEIACETREWPKKNTEQYG